MADTIPTEHVPTEDMAANTLPTEQVASEAFPAEDVVIEVFPAENVAVKAFPAEDVAAEVFSTEDVAAKRTNGFSAWLSCTDSPGNYRQTLHLVQQIYILVLNKVSSGF